MSIARSRSLMVAFAALVLLGGCKAKQASTDQPGSGPVSLSSAPLPAASASAGPKMEGPLRGTLRGKPFLAMSVAFEYRSGQWRVALTGPDRSTLTSTLATPPGAGSISLAGKDLGKPVSTNAFLSRDERIGMSSDFVGDAKYARVEITSWNPAPYDAKKGSTQTVGYASGRLSITMPYTAKDGTQEDSSCTGEFEDALITLGEDPTAPKKK